MCITEPREGEVDGQDLANVHAPSFERDEGRFAGVCSEVDKIRDTENLRPLTLLTAKITIRASGHNPSEEQVVDL